MSMRCPVYREWCRRSSCGLSHCSGKKSDRCSYGLSRGSDDVSWFHFWVLKKDGERDSLLGCGQDREGPLG
jgi:hypothetical protein